MEWSQDEPSPASQAHVRKALLEICRVVQCNPVEARVVNDINRYYIILYIYIIGERVWEREAFCFFVNQFSWGTIWHAKEWTVDALSWQVWRRYLHRAVGVLGASGSTCSCVLNHSKIANVGWLDPGHLATSWDETAAGVLNVNLADSHADFSICVIYIYI